MKSEITLYNSCEIMQNKNFCVENIISFLNLWTTTGSVRKKVVFDECQYFKPNLNVEYKLQGSQTQIELLGQLQNVNYMMVRNYDYSTGGTKVYTRYYFYFITHKERIADNCIKLTLRLDVINSFLQELRPSTLFPTTKINLSPKTLILREHKNRWFDSGIEEGYYLPKIDFYSEGMELPLFKVAENIMLSTDYVANDNSYYLVYRARASGDDAVIDVFLTNDDGLECEIKGGTNGYSGTYPTSVAQYGLCLLIYGNDSHSSHTNVGASVKNTDDGVSEVDFTITSTSQMILIQDTRIIIGTIDGSGFHPTTTITNKAFHRFYECMLGNVFKMRIGQITTFSSMTSSWISNQTVILTPSSSQDERTWANSINDIPRTDPLIVKILKLPYCPFYLGLDVANPVVQIGAGFVLDTTTFTGKKFLRLDNVNIPKTMGTEIAYFLPPKQDGTYSDKMIKSTFEDFGLKQIDFTSDVVSKNPMYETKLLHSDFYQEKFVYDSFSYLIRPECLRAIDKYEYTSTFGFYVSNTLSSKMMFRFTGFEFENVKTDKEDYTNVMYVARNNEMVLYNSAYVNYIKTGYNFDIKTKNRQMASNIIGSLIGIGGGIGTFDVGGKYAKARGVSLFTSSVQNIKDLIFTTAQQEQDILQKLKSAEMQGISVSGSDDVDLMTQYTNGNKMKLVKYRVSPRMQKVLFDLFYYTGYIANYQGVPNTTTRKHFNFVQARIVFENTPNLPQDICDEISAKYEEGITFFHKFGNAGTQYDWDLAQQYENWETTIASANTETLNIE